MSKLWKTVFFALFIGIGLVITAGATRAQEAPKTKTVIYTKTPQAKLKMVITFPPDWKTGDKRSAVVFFFGGGWRAGNVKQFAFQAKYLAERGMVTALADYRVKSRHKTSPDKCVEDGKSAVRYLCENAKKLGIDPNRIVASGGSAGGHVAAATASTPNVQPQDNDDELTVRPNLLVLFNPALHITNEKIVERLGKKLATDICPCKHLNKSVPPAIIFFGTNDWLLDGAKIYVEKAKKVGVKASIYIAKDQKHGFFNRSPWREATLYEMDRFLVKHGYLEGEPKVMPKGDARMKLLVESK
ncbi:MAG: alpha/beta hydrolase [Gemmataceae bacterium]